LIYHFNFGGVAKKDSLSEFEQNYHLGQYAYLYEENPDVYQAVRDPLGIGKLFYTETESGQLHFSDKFVDLYVHGSAKAMP